MEGKFLRNLFTLRLRTRNPFYLVLMLVFGVATTAFMAWVVYAVISTPIQTELSLGDYLLFGLVFLLIGFVLSLGPGLLANLAINLWIIVRGRQRKSDSTKVP